MNTHGLRGVAQEPRSGLLSSWERDVERAWNNASDQGPGWIRFGLSLSQDLISTLLSSKPWRFHRWHDS